MRTGLKFLLFACVFLLGTTKLRAQDTTLHKYILPGKMPAAGTFRTAPTLSIPKDLPTRNFGFFCRQELQFSRNNIPLRFRLGSMEYCNYLEQKPGYRLAPADH